MVDDPRPPETPDALPVPAPHPSGRSAAARALTTQKRKSNRANWNPHAAVNAGVQRLKHHGTAGLLDPIPLETQVRMASTLMAQFYREAQGDTATGERMTANARKQAAVAFGVVVDKVAMLQGLPARPVKPEERESQRPAVWALVRKLALARDQATSERDSPGTAGHAPAKAL